MTDLIRAADLRKAFGPTRADHRVQLIDKQNHVAGPDDFVKHQVKTLRDLT